MRRQGAGEVRGDWTGRSALLGQVALLRFDMRDPRQACIARRPGQDTALAADAEPAAAEKKTAPAQGGDPATGGEA